MSIAKQVNEIGPRLDWLTIEDTDGREWKYKRVGPLDTAEVTEVEGHYSNGHALRAALVRDADGHPLVRQDSAGLPRSIVIEHVDDPTSPMRSVFSLSPKEEYELVG